MAIISLVTGLMCIPIVSIILGHLARSEISKSNGSIVGSGIALAGLILGYLQILFWVLYLAIWVLFTGFFFAGFSQLENFENFEYSSTEVSQPYDMEAAEEEKYYDLTGLITNLGGPIKSRYISIDLRLEGLSGDFEKIIEINEHRIRDKALGIMGQYTYEDAQLDGFQERVRVDLKKVFSIILKDYRNGESELITNIDFTQFVIQ